MLLPEQEYAIGGDMSDEGLDFILDLLDMYIELVESVNQNELRRLK